MQTYPVDQRWRVAARFDAFEQPKVMQIADVRGGSMEYPAVGRLTFRIGEQEQKLTAFQFPDSKEFFVLFKDATNATTTYGFRDDRCAGGRQRRVDGDRFQCGPESTVCLLTVYDLSAASSREPPGRGD